MSSSANDSVTVVRTDGDLPEVRETASFHLADRLVVREGPKIGPQRGDLGSRGVGVARGLARR